MIKLQTIGHLGKDAVLGTYQDRKVLNFTLASTERYKDQQGTLQERTTWLDCSYWVSSDALLPYLKKGKQVFIEGRPELKTYTTKEGKQGASLHVNIFNLQLLGGANKLEQDKLEEAVANDETASLEDKLPF
ncbi:MAG: single-stranded DNA-binding protein [Phycisphaerales bacterium]|nr:single-stranded DNA-binding protein [Phycisphaerales bacterium]